MRQIILLRHAHAEPGRSDLADLERPLTAAGLSEAAAAGAWLRAHDLIPDAALCSPAQRARQTLEGVRASVPVPEAAVRNELYEATPGELMRQFDSVSDADRVLLVGHNPGMEELLPLLTDGRSGDHRGMPPASLAVIEIPAGSTLEPGIGRLLAFWSPGERVSSGA